MSASDSVFELLQELIRIPSVNPAGTPGCATTGEAACAAYVGEFLTSLGAEVVTPEVLPGRPNVVGRFSSPGKPRLLFAPHTDTVSVSGMTIDPFGGDRRAGRIWGRGASDTKGSIAAMLWAFQSLGADLQQLSHEIWFAGLAGEEAGQQGAKALADRERFDFVIAGEPTGMNVVYTHKGCTQIQLVTRGKAVHASAPETGSNAIYKMAAAVQLLEREIAPGLATIRHPVLGSPTLSVGTIEGGSKTNIVPDRCAATVDVRTVPEQETESFFTELEGKLRAVCPDLEIEYTHSHPLFTDPAHPLIRLLEEGGAQCVGAPWFCDAAIFEQLGTPAIAMGPGSIAQAHTEDEWISEEALQGGADGFERFLRQLRR
jgi:acetylornithine deacetylase/succinyl-diaminopimelate desuccinylase-like protein